MQQKPYDVIVIGAGVIGCSIAYYTARAGLRVMLIERGELAGEASRVGAGMLVPLAETRTTSPEPGMDHPLRLFQQFCLAALPCYNNLDVQLKEETGLDIGLVVRPTLRVAYSEESARVLYHEYLSQRELLPDLAWLDAMEVAQHEPVLAGHMSVQGALLSPHEHNVNGQQLALAYARGAACYGAQIVTGCAVRRLATRGGKVTGVETEQGRYVAEQVVIAAGAWSAHWHRPTDQRPIFPRKGQIVKLCPAPASMLRHTVFQAGGETYLVPKADGSIYVGATSEPEAGFDRTATAAGVAELLRGVAQVAPRLLEARFAWVRAGLRPASLDKLPLIGEAKSLAGLWLASGHYRNGILLAPLTGMILAAGLQGKPMPSGLDMSLFDPDRYGGWDSISGV